jgi:hypothetical protein
VPHIDHIALGDAATLRLTVTAEGVALDDVVIGPGWEVRTRAPKPGLLRRTPKPAAYAVLVLDRSGPGGAEEHELEVSRLPDGTWEQAVRRQRPLDPGPFTCPGGTVHVDVGPESPALVDADPSPGWTVRQAEASEHDVVVIFARPDEEWEVVVMPDGEGAAVVDLDHRRQLGAIT